jgi:hypothetical protein
VRKVTPDLQMINALSKPLDRFTANVNELFELLDVNRGEIREHGLVIACLSKTEILVEHIGKVLREIDFAGEVIARSLYNLMEAVPDKDYVKALATGSPELIVRPAITRFDPKYSPSLGHANLDDPEIGQIVEVQEPSRVLVFKDLDLDSSVLAKQPTSEVDVIDLEDDTEIRDMGAFCKMFWK